MAVECHYRDGSGHWRSALLDDGADDVPCPETALSLADIYAGIA